MSEKSKVPFWLVWNPSGSAPRYKHTTYEQAEAEAVRLARENPAQTFYVLAPVCEAIRNDVSLRKFTSDEMPF